MTNDTFDFLANGDFHTELEHKAEQAGSAAFDRAVTSLGLDLAEEAAEYAYGEVIKAGL